MPRFCITKTSESSDSFLANLIRGSFEIKEKSITETFEGDMSLPEKWNVGLIVGASGTGKTTIASEIFKDAVFTGFDYKGKSVIDDMNCKDFDKIIEVFSGVGFGSVPSWLKPYHVLSNGEKMRVDMARLILSKGSNETILYDEFTSFLDRDVARTCAISVAKVMRRSDKKFIGIACHSDIVKFMEPDWVFNTDKMEMTVYPRGSLQRDGIEIEIRSVRPEDYWNYFKKYHYLSHSSKKGIPCIVAFIEGKPAGLFSWSVFPHPKAKNLMYCHRLVIHPNYQGIGLAKILMNVAGDIIDRSGYRLRIATGNYVMRSLLHRMKKTFCITSLARQGHQKKTKGHGEKKNTGRLIIVAEFIRTKRLKDESRA